MMKKGTRCEQLNMILKKGVRRSFGKKNSREKRKDKKGHLSWAGKRAGSGRKLTFPPREHGSLLP